MAAVRLTPEAFVEVDDVVTGGRKIGIVDTTGLGYFDLHGESQLPKVLNEELRPTELGSIASWMSALGDEQRERMVDVWQHLTDENFDLLTIARSLRWGIENESEDKDLMLKMGRAATEQVRAGIKIVEDSVR